MAATPWAPLGLTICYDLRFPALHRALAATNVRNQLLTIPAGGHGRFTGEQRKLIYTTIQEFLMESGFTFF